MSFDAGAITGSLELDTSSFTRGMLNAEGIAHVFPSVVTEFLVNPLVAFMDVAKEATRAVVELFTKATESQAKLHDTADSLGVSASFLDGWSKAAELAGANADELAQSLTLIQRNAFEAVTKGGDAAAVFERLGVALQDADGKLLPVEELARRVADAMANTDAGIERTATAMELFGRSGGRMTAFFAQGSGAIDEYVAKLASMGAITTKEAADSADAFDDLWTEVRHVMTGIRDQIAQPVRDALLPYLKELEAWFSSHPEEIKAFVTSMSKAIVAAVEAMGKIVQWVVGHWEALKTILGAAGIGAAMLVGIAAINLMIGALQRLVAANVEATASTLALKAAQGAGGGGGGGLLGGGLGRTVGFGGLVVNGATIGGAVGGAIKGDIGGTIGGSIGGTILGVIGAGLGGPIGALLGQTIGGALGSYLGDWIQRKNAEVDNSRNAPPTEAAKDPDAFINSKPNGYATNVNVNMSVRMPQMDSDLIVREFQRKSGPLIKGAVEQFQGPLIAQDKADYVLEQL